MDKYLKEIEIKGWKSYSPEGVKLTDLKKINLIIGPNNSGKSNITRFFQSLKDLLGNSKTPNLLVACYMKEKDTWLNLFGDVKGVLKLSHKGSVHNFEIVRNLKENTEILEVDGEASEQSYQNWRRLVLEKIKLYTDVRGFIQNDRSNRIENRYGDTRVSDIIFKNGISNIEWYKKYSENLSKWLSNLMGEDVKLDVKLENPARGQSPYVYDNIVSVESKEREVQHIKQLGLGSQPKRAEFELRITKGGKELSFEPQELGRGIIQFIMFLSALFEHGSKEAIIFIEEPETNLHARSILELIDILENEEIFDKHQYFLLTHSSTILDKINDNYSVHRFEMDGNGTTNVVNCTSKVDKFSTLDLLGVNPSQMLLSNLVIWVEGPSDRIYLNKWIEIYNNKNETNYTEGKHYSFILYGGSLLSHYNVLGDEDSVEEIIDFLCISRYSVIICDSDISDTRTQYKDRVEGVRERLSERTELNSYVLQWITYGREIENYVPKELFIEVITNKLKKREYFTYNNERHYFGKPNPKIIKDKEFDWKLSFDEFFAEMYIRDNELDNRDLSNEIIKNISSNFDKVVIANEIVKLWDIKNNEFISNELDIKMRSIMELLKNANH